jgi:creatinine amidohydrolase
MAGIQLAEHTWEEAVELLTEQSIILLPIGGGTKEHGPHLPLGTDLMVTEELANRVFAAAEAPLVLLPPLAYAFYPAFVDWKGSVSIQAETFKHFVGDIVRSFARHGVKKFLLLDGGVSTHFPLRILSYELRNALGVMVAVTNIRGLGAEMEAEVCEQREGGHADESETSCMLAIRPDLVKLEKALAEYSSKIPHMYGEDGRLKVAVSGKMDSPHGINGDPTLATVDKGRQILEAMAQDIVKFVEAFAALP